MKTAKVLAKVTITVLEGGQVSVESTANYTILGITTSGTATASGNTNEILVKAAEYVHDLQTIEKVADVSNPLWVSAAKRVLGNLGIFPETFDKVIKILKPATK